MHILTYIRIYNQILLCLRILQSCDDFDDILENDANNSSSHLTEAEYAAYLEGELQILKNVCTYVNIFIEVYISMYLIIYG